VFHFPRGCLYTSPFQGQPVGMFFKTIAALKVAARNCETMIEIIRKRLNSVFVLILLGVLIASFAFFGIGDVVQVGQGDTIAKVGSQRITLIDLARTFEGFVERERRDNPELTQSQAIRANVDLRLLQRMVQQAVVSESAKDIGLAASPRRTQAMVASLPAFQLAGKFDPATYKSALARLGVTEEQLFEDYAQEQLIEQITKTLEGAATVPTALAQAQLSALLETRSADAILIPLERFDEGLAPATDEELEAFFPSISARFSAPEYRDFTVLYLTQADAASDVTVSDVDLQQAYDLRQAEYVTQASLELQLMVFDTLEEAQAFKTKAVNGALFLELAEAAGTSRDDVTLGVQTEEEVTSLYGEDIAKALVALSTGAVSEPLKGPFGYQVFRVAGKTSGKTQTFEDVKDALKEELALQLALDKLTDIGNSIEDEFAAGATLEEAAKTFGLTPEVYTQVADTGVTVDGGLAARQPDLQTILPSLFGLEEANELEVERLGENGFYIARVDTVTPRRPRRLDEVRPDVEKAWRQSRLDTLALDAADALGERWRKGEDPRALAGEFEYEFLDGLEFNRVQAQQGSLAQADLAPLLFAMDEGQVDVGRTGDGGSYVVTKLLKKEVGDATANPLLAEQLTQQLQSLVEQELLQQYIVARSNEIERSTNQRALETFRRRYDPTL
ncbi:MAG: SurA N-terminal domain-containing protein, partial [Pseudomonadota bacterium]